MLQNVVASFRLKVIRYIQAIIVSLPFFFIIILSFSTGFLVLIFVLVTSEQLLSVQLPALIIPANYHSEWVN